MSSYEYDHRPRENALSIADGPTGGVWITTVEGTRPPLVVHLPAAERVKAAQALAGEEYVVTPAEEQADQAVDLDAARAKIDSFRDERDAVHRDLGRILAALGLGDHARPVSPHEVVIGEVLPAIEKLKAAEPADVEKAKAAALREAADAIRSTETLFRREDDSPVKVNDLLREMAARYDPPEPDPEQVEALAEQLEATWASGGQSFAAQARHLVRRGVTVGERDE